MSISRSDKPALILVDIQKGFDNIEYWGGQRNNPDAEENASELLQVWRENKLPVFHIQHCSLNQKSLLHESNGEMLSNTLSNQLAANRSSKRM